LTPKGTLPSSRCGHSSCVLDGKLWIFGGRTETPGTFLSRGTFKYINDLYCYDPAINEWFKFEPRGIIPSGRAMHTATIIGRKMLIFGGAHSSGTLHDTSGYCDLYELDFDSMTWQELQYNSTPPSPCYGHSATKIDDDNILYFGGRGYLVHNSVHILDTTTLTWTEYSYCGNVLCPRWGHSATLILNRIILYGGRDSDSYLSSVDIIDLDGQLIPKVTEFTPKEKKNIQREQRNKHTENLISLQTSISQLTASLNEISVALSEQDKEINSLTESFKHFQNEHIITKQQILDFQQQQHRHLYSLK